MTLIYLPRFGIMFVLFKFIFICLCVCLFFINFSLKFHEDQDQTARIRHSLKIAEGVNEMGLQMDFPVNHFLRTFFLILEPEGIVLQLALGQH